MCMCCIATILANLTSSTASCQHWSSERDEVSSGDGGHGPTIAMGT